jgi:hypothetical protein
MKRKKKWEESSLVFERGSLTQLAKSFLIEYFTITCQDFQPNNAKHETHTQVAQSRKQLPPNYMEHEPLFIN